MKDYEEGYIQGRRLAAAELLALAANMIEGDRPNIADLQKERLMVVAALRRVCEEHGDNDWPDNLHLADVIEKHLARHLQPLDQSRYELQPRPDSSLLARPAALWAA